MLFEVTLKRADPREANGGPHKAGTQLRDTPHDEGSVEAWQVGLERAEDLGDHLDESPEHPTHG
jgi:hypothetical protein